MEKCDYSAPWYHGSPEKLTVLQKGSWVTQFQELAKAFSHKPSLISFGDDNQTVKHNGQQPGFLYVVSEALGPDEVSYLYHTAQTHWQIQRDVQVQLVAELPVDDPPQLSEEAITAMHREMPEGTIGFIGERDEE
jgi:hypothetical protein